jgi:heme oxygenase
MNLREATAIKHKLAERMPFNLIMFDGKLTQLQYLEYLKSQHKIFEKIESIILLPNEFLRSGKIYQDIVEMNLAYYNGNNQNNIIDQETKIADSYCNYLSTLDEETIWPHVYLNYLALLFGGQMMKSKIPGSGKMYDFENSQEVIKIIRERQKDEWADEVNKGYDFIIDIFEKLHKKTINV